MKTAIYIEDGRTQLVLQAETDFEQGVIKRIDKGEHTVKIYTGGFYSCQGGWTRWNQVHQSDDSLIIVMDIKDEST